VRPTFACLLLCLLQCPNGQAAGQTAGQVAGEAAELPVWVVPVLRLVSTTHVEPTTGVVLSTDGLVLVAADFASPGDEIVVLDGGKDIVRHGRPARLERGFPEWGLEVLQVDGLRRGAAPLAPAAPKDGSSLRLRAFPPAEQIAEGMAPVNAVTVIHVLAEGDALALAPDNPLPNVTGPLLDECGNLAGFSLADGVQSMPANPATQYRWGAALRTVLTELKLPVSGIPCPALRAVTEEPLPLVEDSAEPPPIAAEPPKPEPAATEPQPAESEADQPVPDSIEHEPRIEMLPPFEEDTGGSETAMEPVAEEPPAASWGWLVAALVLLAAAAVLYRLRRGSKAAPAAQDNGTKVAEGTTPGMAGPEPAQPGLPPAPESRLVLRGMLADGRSFEEAAAVSEHAINVEIGRGGADLAIDSVSVSRRHARLNGTRDALTLTDLGSSNGSTINGVPCLEGEIMYVQPGDTIVLGDARFTVSIETPGKGGGGQ